MKSILIVDDDKNMVNKMCSELSFYRTFSAPGREAMEQAVLEKPDLVLLDPQVPSINGFALLDQFKQHPHLCRVPVMFMASSEDSSLHVEGLKAGAVDFVHKSIDRELLLHRIDMHLKLAGCRNSLEQSVNELEDGIGLSFAELIECKDFCFSGHVTRTASYARLLAQALYDKHCFSGELSPDFISNLFRAVPFHDIGKIGISKEILCKAGKLNDEERKTVRAHTVIGAQILENMDKRIPGRTYFKMAALIARYHHERFDGQGYPSGLAGEDIPLSCRITSVVNVYDACLSKRVYHPAMDHQKALKELQKGRGTEFDPLIVDVFLKQDKNLVVLGRELKTDMDKGERHW